MLLDLMDNRVTRLEEVVVEEEEEEEEEVVKERVGVEVENRNRKNSCNKSL